MVQVHVVSGSFGCLPGPSQLCGELREKQEDYITTSWTHMHALTIKRRAGKDKAKASRECARGADGDESSE